MHHSRCGHLSSLRNDLIKLRHLDVDNNIKKVSKGLMVITTRYKDLTNNRHIYKSIVKTQIQKCLSDMYQYREDIIDKLDKEENKLSSEIRRIEGTMTEEIDGHVILADDSLRQIGDLIKSLSECQKTRRKNDIMFVGMRKAAYLANEYGYILSNIEKDIYPIDIRFQPNDVLADMIQQLQSVGTISTNRPIHTGHGQTSILNIPVTDKQELDVKSKTVLGCILMSDRHLVLACLTDGLKLFDRNFRFKSQSSVFAIGVSAINDTDVIVTQTSLKQLQCVRLLHDMVVKKTLKMDRKCWGVDVNGGEIYVTCHDTPGYSEVRVLKMDGVILIQLGLDNGTSMFRRPNCVKVNRDDSKVFVFDCDTGIVTCLNNQGHVLYQHADRNFKEPLGMYVDGEDSLLVCGYNSDNVHIIRYDGGKEKVLVSKKDGIQYPMYVSYRQSDGCRVVGLHI